MICMYQYIYIYNIQLLLEHSGSFCIRKLPLENKNNHIPQLLVAPLTSNGVIKKRKRNRI